MKRYFVAGLLIWIPIVITIWVLAWIVGTLDQTLLLLPYSMRPAQLLGFHVPGLGVILSVVVVLLTGVVAANMIGQRLVRYWDGLLSRIPVVKSIYYSVKQVSDTLFSSNGQAFRKALLVQYPRANCWTIAFLTGQPGGDAARSLSDHVSVYVPTTPNPTSGFFLMLPRSDVIELDMSVDEALKYIVSMGVVAPSRRASSGAVALQNN
ncbi:MAG: DUF502 domain-containing protein [Sterolibacteriaceae bacterium]|uniref:DUF502 domain-containing protein n=1 Tax=Candidatus Methylophosphatis roskildensis TaxID=2899263 RepID=A0A9D7HPP4_9PROT|nr:DUF502 domain-containing protein [Candidatus Methylophosphatis roskildensis]MBK7234414.1 DUF502 domain-containing protein [Sterolibacteriaceae bacterium]